MTGLSFAVPQQVRARVPDVRDLGPRLPAGAAEANRDDGRPHPGEPLVALADGEDPAVRLLYGGLEGGPGLELPEHVDGDVARHLARLEAADAVGDREQRLVAALADEERVLVVGADLARVGGAEGFEVQHSPGAYSSYLKVVEPTRTVSPCLRGVAPTVLRPLTNVPLVEPRSST